MLNISGPGVSLYRSSYAPVYSPRAVSAPQAVSPSQAASASQAVQIGTARAMALPSAQPGVPVQPVDAVRSPDAAALDTESLLRWWESDPVAAATRSRIQYTDGTDRAQSLPDWEETDKASDAKSPREVAEEGECETCKRRKYQDGSDDPGVSFKSPAHIDPDMASSTVRGHEMEHVTREQDAVRREGRRVLSQSVTYHTAICPECGRVYTSGGTTRTVTSALEENGYTDLGDEETPTLSAAFAGLTPRMDEEGL